MQTSARSTSTHGLEQVFVGDVHDRVRFERGADALLRALDLQRAGDDAAHGAHLPPLVGELVVAPGGRHFGEQFEVHRLRRRAIARGPGLFGREAQHRRQPRHRAAEQMIEHGQAGLARRRRDRIAIERVLADVEIERRQVRRHEGRERGEDALVVEIGVGLAHQLVELGEPVQHQPLQLRHLLELDALVLVEMRQRCRASSAWCCAACGRSRRWSSGFPGRCADRRRSPRRTPTCAGCRRPTA